MGYQVHINTTPPNNTWIAFIIENNAMVWPNVLFSHKHVVYMETIELVIDTLIKQRVDASQNCNKLLQFHIAYTKPDKT